jgi:hypothetical protein
LKGSLASTGDRLRGFPGGPGKDHQTPDALLHDTSTSMQSITQVVVSLPPRIDGIRDYALRLAEGLRAIGMASSFLAAHSDSPDCVRLNGLAARELARRDGGSLARALSNCGAEVVLLHYSGYGYARRGAPFWLLQGLTRWKRDDPRRHLVVMFHEVWATGPPWRSSFWMQPLQALVAAGVTRLADAFLTNTERHAARLARLVRGRQPLAVLPVLSNIGEPQSMPAYQDRPPAALVFGQRGQRERVYAGIGDFLDALAPARIDHIYDLGPPLDGGLIAACPLPVVQLGYLDAAAASDVMLRCRVGLLDYPLDFAAKSGNLAAYAAHGVVPLIRSAVGGEHDGLRQGVNIACVGEPSVSLEDPTAASRIARAAHFWYEQHAIDPTARIFARALRSAAEA